LPQLHGKKDYGQTRLYSIAQVVFSANVATRLFVLMPNKKASNIALSVGDLGMELGVAVPSIMMLSAPPNAVAELAMQAVDEYVLFDEDGDAWEVMGRDATRIEDFGALAATAYPLVTQAWHEGAEGRRWRQFRSYLLKIPDGQVWIDWYERILSGVCASKEVEEAYLLPDAPELWKQDFETVCAEIAKRLKAIEEKQKLSAYDDQNLENLKNEIEKGSGATIEIIDGQARLKVIVDPSDLAAAQTREAKTLHKALLKVLPPFIENAKKAGNQQGWAEFGRTAEDYQKFVNRDLVAISEEITQFWLISSKLGTYLNQDDDLRDGRQSFAEPLDPETRRTFVDVLTSGVPLVRKFSTAQSLDDDYINWNQTPEKAKLEIEVIVVAEQQEILHAPSAAIIRDAQATGQKSGVQAAKSRSWARRMMWSFIVSAGLVTAQFTTGVLTKAGERYSEKSEIVRRFTDYLLSQEAKLLELMKDLPPDMAGKIREMFRRLREEKLPSPPSHTDVAPLA
jgi:hypothetical protein